MLQLRLKPEQVEEREQAEAGVAEIKTEIEQESDPDKKASLTAELNSRQEKLEALLENFQVRPNGSSQPERDNIWLTNQKQ